MRQLEKSGASEKIQHKGMEEENREAGIGNDAHDTTWWCRKPSEEAEEGERERQFLKAHQLDAVNGEEPLVHVAALTTDGLYHSKEDGRQ